MDRLVGKNILIIIPKDYYMESEFDPVFEAMTAEGATVLVASSKLKEAIGMKSGRTNPDVLIVDCLLYTSPSPRDQRGSRMPSSA